MSARQPVRERRVRCSAVYAPHVPAGRGELRASGERLRRSARLRHVPVASDLWRRRSRERLRRRRSLTAGSDRDTVERMDSKKVLLGKLTHIFSDAVVDEAEKSSLRAFLASG